MKGPAFFAPLQDVPARIRMAIRAWGGFGLFSIAGGLFFLAIGAWLLATSEGGEGFTDLAGAITIGFGIISVGFGGAIALAVHLICKRGPKVPAVQALAGATVAIGLAAAGLAIAGWGPPDLLIMQALTGGAIGVLGVLMWPQATDRWA